MLSYNAINILLFEDNIHCGRNVLRPYLGSHYETYSYKLIKECVRGLSGVLDVLLDVVGGIQESGGNGVDGVAQGIAGV